ncbi:MAG: class I SAM-dependent methyltransferase [Thermodesulfobacteriota bacterium]|nr:MAG: class I SAM-dependent methyltransferase [Thermodesulfobacteriota bacterium]
MKGFIDKTRYRSRLNKLGQIIEVLGASPKDKLLEVGVANREYSEVDNFLVKHYPYPENITALGLGDISIFRKRYPHIRAFSYEGGGFPFNDHEFDIVHSNAVIEHVGGPEAQRLFLKELARVAKKGLITTPNRYFPVETHTKVPFLHWLRKDQFDFFLEKIGKRWATGAYMHLLSGRDLDNCAHGAGLSDYRIIRNRLFGLTLTFTLVWSTVKKNRQEKR